MYKRLKYHCSMVRDHFYHARKKAACAALVASLSAVSCLPVLASEGSSVVTYGDFSSIIDTIKAQVSVSTIVGVIGSVTAVCIGLVFFWWAFRKVVRMIMKAFRGGRYSA